MGGRVSKTLSEADACVSAEAESGSCEHGVRDNVFAFLPPMQASAIRAGTKKNRPPFQEGG